MMYNRNQEKGESEFNQVKKRKNRLWHISIILAFVGAGYVLYNGEKAHAGYDVVLMVFVLAGIVFLPKQKRTLKNIDEFGGV